MAASNAARQVAINVYIKPELRDAANPPMQEMEMSLDRMRIRVGKEDPRVRAFEGMGNAAQALLRATAPRVIKCDALARGQHGLGHGEIEPVELGDPVPAGERRIDLLYPRDHRGNQIRSSCPGPDGAILTSVD